MLTAIPKSREPFSYSLCVSGVLSPIWRFWPERSIAVIALRIMTATSNAILKSDRRGRLRYSTEQKSAMVEAYQSSGLSGPRFAALHGVNYQTLAGWLQKRKQRASPIIPRPSHPAVLSLVEAEIQAMPPAAAMELILPGGAKLVITAPGHIPLAAALIRELANPRPC